VGMIEGGRGKVGELKEQAGCGLAFQWRADAAVSRQPGPGMRCEG
jgi:hypothetical protein